MVVTRSMSGTTKKADTKVAVNHKVAETRAERERASKKTRAERERARKKLARHEKVIRRLRKNEMELRQKAVDIFVAETFVPLYMKNHPGAKNTLEVVWSGYEEWDSLTDSDKASYLAEAKKIEDEQIAAADEFFKNRHLY